MNRAIVLAVWLIAVAFGFQPAASQTASPEATAAARELVETMRAADQFKTIMPLLMRQLKPMITQGRPEIERDFDSILPQIMAAAEGRMNEFVGGVAALYATHFNADELRQITAFYKAPVGQKFLQVLPKVMQDSMVLGQKFGESIAGDMRGRMIEELRKRGHNI